MRTTLDLPNPLFRELKAQAARKSMKMKELLATYVEAGLYGRSSSRPEGHSPRSPLPVARRSTGITLPALTNAQAQHLLDEDDVQRTH
jgi:hypothetical protein